MSDTGTFKGWYPGFTTKELEAFIKEGLDKSGLIEKEIRRRLTGRG